jgi:hypothetical protein
VLTMPSADFCGAVREACSPLRPQRGHLAARPWSAVIPSVHRRRIDQAQPNCGWRAWRWRARSPRLYHPSSPVRGPRPARAFHAAFRPHLTGTPWRFPGPSAPRIPGQGTFTPEHDSMPGTHAGPEPRGPPRRLQQPMIVAEHSLPETPWSRCPRVQYDRRQACDQQRRPAKALE